jgi:hypothetical protein
VPGQASWERIEVKLPQPPPTQTRQQAMDSAAISSPAQFDEQIQKLTPIFLRIIGVVLIIARISI